MDRFLGWARPSSRVRAKVRQDCMYWAICKIPAEGDPYAVLATAQLFEEYILEGKVPQAGQ